MNSLVKREYSKMSRPPNMQSVFQNNANRHIEFITMIAAHVTRLVTMPAGENRQRGHPVGRQRCLQARPSHLQCTLQPQTSPGRIDLCRPQPTEDAAPEMRPVSQNWLVVVMRS